MNVDAVVQQVADAPDRTEMVNQVLRVVTKAQASTVGGKANLAYNAALVTALSSRGVWPVARG